jgi:hypothetical protein
MVYWRDTRRAVGAGGFKLLHTQLRDNGPYGIAAEGTPFADTIALGDYNDDCHHLASSVCKYPAYMEPYGARFSPWILLCCLLASSGCGCYAVCVFRLQFALEDVINSHACSLEALPCGCPLAFISGIHFMCSTSDRYHRKHPPLGGPLYQKLYHHQP